MKISVSGKTIEEAVRIGLQKLNVTEDRVNVSVIEQPTKGFFGLIGSREAKVELEIIPDPAEEGLKFLQNVVKESGIAVTAKLEQDKGTLMFYLEGDEVGIFIGRRGQTLDALQYLVSIVVNRYSDKFVPVVLDAENFRERRKKTLEQLASRLADKVAASGKETVLEPMSSKERRIIHAKLQHHPRVSTYSKGVDPNRRIVIGPKD